MLVARDAVEGHDSGAGVGRHGRLNQRSVGLALVGQAHRVELLEHDTGDVVFDPTVVLDSGLLAAEAGYLGEVPVDVDANRERVGVGHRLVLGKLLLFLHVTEHACTVVVDVLGDGAVGQGPVDLFVHHALDRHRRRAALVGLDRVHEAGAHVRNVERNRMLATDPVAARSHESKGLVGERGGDGGHTDFPGPAVEADGSRVVVLDGQPGGGIDVADEVAPGDGDAGLGLASVDHGKLALGGADVKGDGAVHVHEAPSGVADADPKNFHHPAVEERHQLAVGVVADKAFTTLALGAQQRETGSKRDARQSRDQWRVRRHRGVEGARAQEGAAVLGGQDAPEGQQGGVGVDDGSRTVDARGGGAGVRRHELGHLFLDGADGGGDAGLTHLGGDALELRGRRLDDRLGLGSLLLDHMTVSVGVLGDDARDGGLDVPGLGGTLGALGVGDLGASALGSAVGGRVASAPGGGDGGFGAIFSLGGGLGSGGLGGGGCGGSLFGGALAAFALFFLVLFMLLVALKTALFVQAFTMRTWCAVAAHTHEAAG